VVVVVTLCGAGAAVGATITTMSGRGEAVEHLDARLRVVEGFGERLARIEGKLDNVLTRSAP